MIYKKTILPIRTGFAYNALVCAANSVHSKLCNETALRINAFVKAENLAREIGVIENRNLVMSGERIDALRASEDEVERLTRQVARNASVIASLKKRLSEDVPAVKKKKKTVKKKKK